jgi:hypothetical protein
LFKRRRQAPNAAGGDAPGSVSTNPAGDGAAVGEGSSAGGRQPDRLAPGGQTPDAAGGSGNAAGGSGAVGGSGAAGGSGNAAGGSGAVGGSGNTAGGSGAVGESADRSAEAGPVGEVTESGEGETSFGPGGGAMVDFGALQVPLWPGVKATLEVERDSGRAVALVLAHDGSRMRLAAYAAPKTRGIWETVMRDEQSAVVRAGGSVKDATGPFGPELVAQLPQTTAQGRQGKQVVRFIGIDGPRWLLRAVLAGKAARDKVAAEPFIDVLRRTQVERGTEAMPPRELLMLRPPALVTADGADPADSTADDDPTALLERGPEITEVR